MAAEAPPAPAAPPEWCQNYRCCGQGHWLESDGRRTVKIECPDCAGTGQRKEKTDGILSR